MCARNQDGEVEIFGSCRTSAALATAVLGNEKNATVRLKLVK